MTELTDLRTATPLTQTLLYTYATGCTNALITTEWKTASVQALEYVANPITWTGFGGSTITVPVTYPSLIVTLLKPGEQLVIVYSFTGIMSYGLLDRLTNML